MLSIWISLLTFILGLQVPIGAQSSAISSGNELASSRSGEISGHVTLRETGEPLSEIEVSLLQKRFDEEGVEEIYLLGSQRTNEKGEYQFFVSFPGRFQIGTGAQPTGGKDVYIPELVASGISLQPPQKVNIDVAVERGKPVAIRGHLIDGTGHRFQHLDWVWLSASRFGSTVPDGASGRSHYHNSNTFEITDVVPGFYYLCGYRFDDLTHRADTVVPIAVRDSDLEVDLVSEEAYDLGGRVRFSGTQRSLPEMRIAIGIGIRPIPDPLHGATAIHARIRPDGFFTLPSNRSGTYRLLDFLNVPPAFYVKAARIDNIDVFEKGIKLPGAAKAAQFLDIQLADDGGQVRGSVMSEPDKPAVAVTVVLVPESHGMLRPDLYKKDVTDSFGQFSITGIAPGEYRAYAWKGLYDYEYFDPAFLKQFEGAGLRVQIIPRGVVKLQLQVRNARPS